MMGKPGRKSMFSPDEIINIKLRAEAGEALQSIADDYSVSRSTIQYHVIPRYRERKLSYFRDRAKFRREQLEFPF